MSPTASQRRVCPCPPGQSGRSLPLRNGRGQVGDPWEQLSSPSAQLPLFIPAVCQAGLRGQRGSASACPKGSRPGVETPGPLRATCLESGGQGLQESHTSLEAEGRTLQAESSVPCSPTGGQGGQRLGRWRRGERGQDGGQVPGPAMLPEGPEAPGGLGTGQWGHQGQRAGWEAGRAQMRGSRAKRKGAQE